MFFAIELQISIVYVLFHLQGLGPSKRSIRYRKIAMGGETASKIGSSAAAFR